MVMKLEQITEALKNGHLETVKKELCRYGDILDLKDWNSIGGAHRVYTINRLGSVYTISMRNGETLSIKEIGA